MNLPKHTIEFDLDTAERLDLVFRITDCYPALGAAECCLLVVERRVYSRNAQAGRLLVFGQISLGLVKRP